MPGFSVVGARSTAAAASAARGGGAAGPARAAPAAAQPGDGALDLAQFLSKLFPALLEQGAGLVNCVGGGWHEVRRILSIGVTNRFKVSCD